MRVADTLQAVVKPRRLTANGRRVMTAVLTNVFLVLWIYVAVEIARLWNISGATGVLSERLTMEATCEALVPATEESAFRVAAFNSAPESPVDWVAVKALHAKLEELRDNGHPSLSPDVGILMTTVRDLLPPHGDPGWWTEDKVNAFWSARDRITTQCA